ncbi:inosine-uridine preferring nucleoside hydrolase-like isoform X2 [Argonauta hians]
MGNKKIIIDTDPGIDDAQAILIALGKDSNVDIVALTTVQGNVPVKNTSLNALRLLKVANRQDIPVFQGCENPMLQAPHHAGYYHGEDGFGDAPDGAAPGAEHLQKEHAVNSLIHLVNQQPGELSLVALGPLTNIATAISLDSQFGTKLKDCVIMGGNYKGIGNVTASAEFNFFNDPEAAHVVLEKLSCPITMVTWELCEGMKYPPEFLTKLTSQPGDKASFMKNITGLAAQRSNKNQHYIMCDELAMVAAMRNDSILESHDVYAQVEVAGKLTRGQVVLDWRNITGKTPNVKIVTKMDTKIIEDLLFKAYNS